MAAKHSDHRRVGWKRQDGNIVKRVKRRLIDIIARTKAATDYLYKKPDSYCVHLGIMKVREYGENALRFDPQARFFKKLSSHCVPYVFIIFNITTGNAPQTWIGGVITAPAKQDFAFLQTNSRHANYWILIHNITAICACQPLDSVTRQIFQRSTAFGAKRKSLFHKNPPEKSFCSIIPFTGKTVNESTLKLNGFYGL
jgi:hypothetical protein